MYMYVLFVCTAAQKSPLYFIPGVGETVSEVCVVMVLMPCFTCFLFYCPFYHSGPLSWQIYHPEMHFQFILFYHPPPPPRRSVYIEEYRIKSPWKERQNVIFIEWYQIDFRSTHVGGQETRACLWQLIYSTQTLFLWLSYEDNVFCFLWSLIFWLEYEQICFLSLSSLSPSFLYSFSFSYYIM
jgi:hypothetical protein